MPYYEFKKKDVLYNTLKTYPEFVFSVVGGRVYLNNEAAVPGTPDYVASKIRTGCVNLYELNINRAAADYIYPFMVKGSGLDSLGTITKAGFNSSYQYGDIMSGSYPLSASIVRELFDSGRGDSATSRITALKNTLNSYSYLSPHYIYSSSLGDKAQQSVNLVSIHSIFFDSGIKKGSVDLGFYVSGTLAARLQDKYQDGNLIQTTGSVYATAQAPDGTGSVAGVVLYDQGFVVLTGSWDITGESLDFGAPLKHNGTWLDYAAGANDGNTISATDITMSASFELKFLGTSPVSTVTMHAHAPLGYLNNSSNPTFKLFASSSALVTTSSYFYTEPAEIPVKNTMSSSFCNFSASFRKQTFISKVGIFDKDQNLIAIANLATPVKKLEDRDYTFKIKLDI